MRNDKTKWQKKQSLEAWAELRSRLKSKDVGLISDQKMGMLNAEHGTPILKKTLWYMYLYMLIGPVN